MSHFYDLNDPIVIRRRGFSLSGTSVPRFIIFPMTQVGLEFHESLWKIRNESDSSRVLSFIHEACNETRGLLVMARNKDPSNSSHASH